MQPISLSTRKPVDKLTRVDFDEFPVWEYADDEESIPGRDETWVRPVKFASVPPHRYTHVAANFIAPAGKTYFGSVTVSTLDGAPDVCQGAILYRRNWRFISNPEAFCFDESRQDLLQTLGLPEDGLFPLAFQLHVPVVGYPEYRGGTLP